MKIDDENKMRRWKIIARAESVGRVFRETKDISRSHKLWKYNINANLMPVRLFVFGLAGTGLRERVAQENRRVTLRSSVSYEPPYRLPPSINFFFFFSSTLSHSVLFLSPSAALPYFFSAIVSIYLGLGAYTRQTAPLTSFNINPCVGSLARCAMTSWLAENSVRYFICTEKPDVLIKLSMSRIRWYFFFARL